MRLAHIAAIILTMVFLHQCYLSITKYLEGNVGKSLYTSDEDVYILPSITICPADGFAKPGESTEIESYKYLVNNKLLKVEDYLVALAIEDDRNLDKMTAKQSVEMGAIYEFLSPVTGRGDAWFPTNCFLFKGFSAKATANLTNISASFQLVATNPSIVDYIVWIHPVDEFLPVKISFFDAVNLIVSTAGLDQKRLSKLIIYKLTTKLLHRMNTDNTICNEGGIKLEPCLRKYLDSEIGCDVYANLTDCFTEQHIRGYVDLARRMSGKTDNQITELTKCSLSCDTHEYDYTVVGETETQNPPGADPTIRLTFRSASHKNKVEKDVLLYDFNNLVADIGGLLGLLLGASILGLINEGEKFFRNLMSK